MYSLLRSAKSMAAKRLELLLLLSLLAGLLTSFLYGPAVDVVNAVAETLSAPDVGEAEVNEAASILSSGLGTLILGQLSLIAISALLLPIWARAAAPGGLIPGEGGIASVISRGIRAFKYLIIATGLTISSFVAVAPIAALLSQMLGSLPIAAGGILVLWLSLTWSATANAAIALSVDDKSVTFRAAWSYTKIFLRPIVGAYAALWLIAGVVNLLLSNLAAQMLPPEYANSLSLVITGTVSYASTAMHLSCIFSLPEKLNPLNEA